MFPDRKKLLKSLLAISAGCGCSSSSKPHEIKDSLQTRPREQPAEPILSPCSSSVSYIDTDGTLSDDRVCASASASAATLLSSRPAENQPRTSTRLSVTRIENSVAVEKHSDDPYSDFKDSMLQMISANKDIYSKQDLQKLLSCFLQLNSPAHHRVIIRAFMEILSSISWTASPNNR